MNRGATLSIPPSIATVSLTSLSMSVRLQNCLAAGGYSRLGDLNGVSFGDLLRIKNFGRTSMTELVRLLDVVSARHRSVIGELHYSEAESPSTDSAWFPPHFESLANSTSAAYLPALARRVRADLSGKEVFVLDQRLDLTLAEVGVHLSVTRERIRQIELKAVRRMSLVLLGLGSIVGERLATGLSAVVIHEEQLFESLRDPVLPAGPQNRLGRILLAIMFPEACNPSWFQTGRVKGWWTMDEGGIARHIRRLRSHCPIADEDLDRLAEQSGIPSAFPLRSLLASRAPIRFYPTVQAWVRRGAVDRDASVSVLQKEGGAMPVFELVNRLGDTTARALTANLIRDRRMRQLRPSGLWTLVEWMNSEDEAAVFKSTADAVLSVLSEHGPLSRKDLFRRVFEVYPVSPWAIANALEADAVGLTPAGLWDLVARGARPRLRPEPMKPLTVTETEDRRLLMFSRVVDRELLRGSGLGISHYIAWRAGLKWPGEKREFSSTIYPSLQVRRSFGSCSMSTLRQQALDLGASIGDQLVITLEFTANEYHIRLGKQQGLASLMGS